ncbi:hypothetical protein TrLO_g11349 [Triparma laevis f. longispina]|uniref:Uncharacterized protein n=1 Tax=Triparma laevis f. longispina TaxID=1714387 RepID=A0A9W7C5C7_9STRA|nr:hypothetical protein TrLO_g11349 [Triparma laevis f. longispina]
MSLLPPVSLTFTLPQLTLFLKQTASRYMLQGKISDKNKEIAVNLLSDFLVYAKSPTNVAEFEQAKAETVVNSNIS